MKHLIFLFSLLFFFSCTKDESGSNQNGNDTLLTIPIDYSQLVDLKSDVATFKSEEDFNSFMKTLPTLTHHQKLELANQTSFTSVEEHLESLYDQLDLIDNREAFIFANQNSEYLEIVTNDIGDEEVVEKEISQHTSAIIHNTDRIIKVGDIYYKYISDLVVKNKDYQALKVLKSSEDVKNSRMNFEKAYEILGKDNSVRWTDLGKAFSLQAEKNPSGCKNDRRVKFSWVLFEFTDQGGDITGKRIHLLTEIHPTKKGIPCIWYRYKTVITRNNFNFTGNIRVTNSSLTSSFNVSIPNTVVTSSSLDSDNFLFGFIPIGDQKAEACFTRERVDVTTQGKGGLWINLNQSKLCN
ncbi:MAG: hypothetical protein IPN86_14005 [Saprospiraceae bacterium]|nr:hypothetical protein [Saprospiraceae bacterium]